MTKGRIRREIKAIEGKKKHLIAFSFPASLVTLCAAHLRHRASHTTPPDHTEPITRVPFHTTHHPSTFASPCRTSCSTRPLGPPPFPHCPSHLHHTSPHQITLVDLPGFGKTGSFSGDATLLRATLVSDLLTLLAPPGANKSILVSPSMSGEFALPYLAQCASKLGAWVPVAPVQIGN